VIDHAILTPHVACSVAWSATFQRPDAGELELYDKPPK
jgi:hypothetical protein